MSLQVRIPFLVAAATLTIFDPGVANADDEASQEREAEVVVTGTHIRGLPKEYVASPVFTVQSGRHRAGGFGLPSRNTCSRSRRTSRAI